MNSLKFVIVGHVDHGKSTLIGRLLADTDALPKNALEKVKTRCVEKGQEFEYAYLLDAFEEEQDQGVTIDTTQIEFKTKKRHYTIIDAPGHRDFIKNMVTGAAYADAAVLMLDAHEGVKEQTKRHLQLLSLLGIRQFLVIVNKMDLVDYAQARYESLKKEVEQFLALLELKAMAFIPVSAKKGDLVTKPSEQMSWWEGPTFLNALDMFEQHPPLDKLPLRIPIQDVYKFDERRILAGRIESGTIRVGDKITLHPENKCAQVLTIENWPKNKEKTKSAFAGSCVGITIDDEFYYERGWVITHDHEKPIVSNLFTCKFFWLGAHPMTAEKTYTLKLNTQEVDCQIHTINKIFDAETLTNRSQPMIMTNDVAEIVLRTKKPIVFDEFQELPHTGRFVIVDEGIVCGGGIIEKMATELRQRSEILAKNTHVAPHTHLVSLQERNKRAGHKGSVLWLTGYPGCGKDVLAEALERKLFDEGKQVYYLSTGTIRLSLSNDLDFSEPSRREQARRVAEVANILMQAGFIVIVAIVSPYRAHRALARSIIGEDDFVEVFVDTPLEICKQNNPHGLYDLAKKGDLKNVPGIDIDYEQSETLVHTLRISKKDFSVAEKVAELLRVVRS